MLMEAFIPIFSILGLGMGIQYFISARFDFKLSRGDFYLAAVLIGEFVLIFSMGIVGILTKNGLWLIPRLYLVISTTLSTAAIYHYVTHNLHRLESFRSPFPEEWTGEHVLALLVGLFLLEYIFLILIFPLRGFDALERYLPDAFYFYQQDSIPKINALTATPTFKSPAHTLLFTYVLYVSRKEEYYLIPFLTLFSLVVVAYKFGEVFLGSPRRGWLAALLLLALPLTKELVTNWAYYQDLYIAFYFAAGIYFFLLAFHHQRTGYSIVSGLAVGLAILAKMSGWALPVIILLLAPAGRKGRVLKVVMLIPMASWLAMKAATKTFVGVSFAIALIAFLLILLIYLAPLENASVTRTTTPIIIGILAGGWWIWRTAIMLPGSFDTLAEFYFQIKGSPQWEYPVHASQGSILALEQLHSVSFLG
ncbi:MAG: glycosyltransferase family 39 protein, partial [Candidatus Thorarchaeota archaeon]